MKKQEERALLKMTKKHTKHTDLTKRNNGIHAPNEVALVGAKCSLIEQLVFDISKHLEKFKLGYFDASHTKDKEGSPVDVFTFHHEGSCQIEMKYAVNKFNQRIQFSQYDLIFVNGNHYPAQKHIVLLHPDKEASIEQRMDQIEEVVAFVKVEADVAIFDCLKKKFSNYAEIPLFDISQVDEISQLLLTDLEQKIPVLEGLILMGGKSSRMGTDKSALDYHGQSQRDYLKALLEGQQIKTYFSKRSDQALDEENTIDDSFIGLGPSGALCSAFRAFPNTAFFVLAADLPFVDEQLVQKLIVERDASKAITAVIGKGQQFGEPLVAIWEPKSYPLLLNFIAQGYSCPRKVLINSDVKLIEVDTTSIRNINTPEEFEQAKKELNG